jgi:hypothetical protein
VFPYEDFILEVAQRCEGPIKVKNLTEHIRTANLVFNMQIKAKAGHHNVKEMRKVPKTGTVNQKTKIHRIHSKTSDETQTVYTVAMTRLK